jgi:hypothetical protein
LYYFCRDYAYLRATAKKCKHTKKVSNKKQPLSKNGEQNNVLREQDNMLWEQNIFLVGTRYYNILREQNKKCSRMALISHRNIDMVIAKIV